MKSFGLAVSPRFNLPLLPTRSLLRAIFGVVTCVAVLYLALLFVPATVFAQDAAPPAQPTTGGIVTRLGFMFISVYLIFHLFVIKPQKAKLQEQQNLLNTLKRGEQVVTSGGIVAKVAGVEKEYALLELAPNVKVKVEIAHISKRLDKPAA